MNARRFLFYCGLAVQLLLLSQSAGAAPFCAIYGWGSQCVYPNLDACLNAVGDSAECLLNESEAKHPEGNGKYCVVSNGGSIRCVYEEEEACRAAAYNAAGMCLMRLPDQAE